MQRKVFLQSMVHWSWVALLRQIMPRNGEKPDSKIAAWWQGHQDLAAALRRAEIHPQTWQESVLPLCSAIDRQELLRLIDFEKLYRQAELPAFGSRVFRLPHHVFGPNAVHLAPKIFANQRGTAVIPHVHNQMVSAHLVLAGHFHVRTYHRLFESEQPGYIALKPSLDQVFGPGDVLTMSDDCDNGHWLVAESERAFTLDIALTELPFPKSYANPGNRYSMIFVDPTEKPSDHGIITAPILDFEKAMARFGGPK